MCRNVSLALNCTVGAVNYSERCGFSHTNGIFVFDTYMYIGMKEERI